MKSNLGIFSTDLRGGYTYDSDFTHTTQCWVEWVRRVCTLVGTVLDTGTGSWSWQIFCPRFRAATEVTLGLGSVEEKVFPQKPWLARINNTHILSTKIVDATEPPFSTIHTLGSEKWRDRHRSIFIRSIHNSHSIDLSTMDGEASSSSSSSYVFLVCIFFMMVSFKKIQRNNQKSRRCLVHHFASSPFNDTFWRSQRQFVITVHFLSLPHAV